MSKLFSWVCLCTLLSLLPTSAAQLYPAKLGDLDNDNTPTALDLAAILNHMSGTQRLSNEMTVFADVNQDGVVNELDLDIVVDAILGLQTLPDLPLARILGTSPSGGAQNVSVTRETIVRFSQPLSASTVITLQKFYAEFGGQKLIARVELAPDRRAATLFYSFPLPGNARVRVTFNGNAFPDFAGRLIDADGDGQPGGVAVFEFDTLSQTAFPNTIVCGRVFASELATNATAGTNMSVNTPLAGVTVTADGLEQQVRAVTDQFGNFRLTNAPAGNFFVHVDGRTVTNLATGIRWPDLRYYPYVGKEWESLPGGETNIGEVFLPLIIAGTLRSVSATSQTLVTFPTNVIAAHPELEGVTLTVPANALFNDSGLRGGKVGIAPVPADRLPGALPNGLSFPLVITVQTDGPSNFSEPVPVCFPNLTNAMSGQPPLPPGAKSALWSFNHDTGQWEVIGPMTVSDDGRLICSDPGVGILAPGWHGAAPGTPGGGGSTNPVPPSYEPPGKDKDPKNKNPEDKVSDPVKLFSGEFQEKVEDLRIPGVGFDFVWTRTYRSKTALTEIDSQRATLTDPTRPHQTGQGYGWDFSYNISTRPSGRGVEVRHGNGRADVFRQQLLLEGVSANANAKGFFERFFGYRGYAARVDFINVALQCYSQTTADGTKYTYNLCNGSPTSGKIASITDRNNNQMSFEYDGAGRLTRVLDTLGRAITVGYNADGLIASVTDFTGRSVRYAYYAQNETGGSPGDLKSVTTPNVTGTPHGNDFPNGKTTTYTYTKGFADERLNHNLLTITDGRRNDPSDPTFGQGPYLANVYSTTTDPNSPNFDRVVRQVWGGSTVLFTYIPQTPSPANNGAFIKTIVADRKSHVKEFYYDAANLLVMQREFTGSAIPGLPTTETVNRPAGKLRSDDPVYFETRYSYNADEETTRIVHPNGNVTEYVYQGDVDPAAPSTRRHNLLAVRHLPGTHLPVGDQPFIIEQFEYLQDFNFVTRHVDGRGNELVNQYDARGNRTNTIHRIAGITEQFAYNERGQMTRHVFPDNGNGVRREDAMTYYASGPQRGYLHQRIADDGHLNLTTSFEYDAVGNIVRTIDPRGRDTIFAVNQLNQVVRETSREVADGSGLRYQKDIFYDANDNITRLETQNRDETGTVLPNASFTTAFEYEILDKLTRRSDEVSETNSIVTEYAYDQNRNRTLTRLGEATAGRQPANVVQAQYDERDLPFRTIRAPGDAAQSTTQFDYDRNGNRTREWQGLESAPRLSQFAYDGFNRLVAATNAMGNASLSYYDSNGNTVRTLVMGEFSDAPGAAGNIRLADSSFGYDPLNRRTNTATAFFDPATQAPIDDGVAATRVLYTDASQVQAVINDNGHGSTNRYDSAHRLERTTDAAGNTTQLAYDANGNLTGKIETEVSTSGAPAETFTTTFVYDGLDRLTRTVDSAGNTNRLAYDSRGNAVLRVDARGNVVRSEFDGLSRLTATTRQLTGTGDGTGSVIGSIITRQLWDDSSRLIARTDPNGNATTMFYDALSRPLATRFADGTGVTNIFDVHNNAQLAFDANGNIVTNSYDLLNRLTRRDVQGGSGVSAATTFEMFGYDGLSRVVLASNNVSLVTRAYDSLSRLTRETQNGLPVATAFDGVGNALRLTYPSGRVLTNAFDPLERKVEITDETGTLVRWNYIGPARVRSRLYSDGTRADFAYDGINGVPNSSGDYGVRQLVRTTSIRTNDSTVLDDRAFAWDAAGSKTLRQDLRVGGPQVTQDLHYDSVNRLTQSARAPPSETIAYALDAAGNRLSVTGGSNAGSYALSAALPEPADRQLNQYTATPFDTRTNDANGNLVAVNPGQPGERRFGYDYRNRLVAFTNAATGLRAAYAYDALDRRIQKTVTSGATQTTRFLYDGQREIEERDGGGAVLATYVHGIYLDELVQMRRAGQDYFYHADDQRSVTAVTLAGAVVERYDYGDFGSFSISAANGTPLAVSQIGNPWLLTGRRLDAETGLHYFRSRYYDSAAGRFISRDRAGMWFDVGNLGNGYAFLGNNPWSFVDPSGFSKEPWWKWAKDGIDRIGATGGELITGFGMGAIEFGMGLPGLVTSLREDPWGTITSIPANFLTGAEQLGGDLYSGDWRRAGHGLFNLASTVYGAEGGFALAERGLPTFGRLLGDESGAGYIPRLTGESAANAGATLPAREIGNFIGHPSQVAIGEGEIFYGIRDAGSRNVWWTRTQPEGELQWRMDQSVLPQWNEATHIETLTVPRGQSLIGFEGSSRGQGWYLGGGNQVYIPNVPSGWSTVERWR